MLQLKLSEATASNRRIPLYLVSINDGITPATSITFSTGDIKISKNGAAEVNHSGSAVEIGNGNYYYESTSGELDTIGYLYIRFTGATIRTFVSVNQVVSFNPYYDFTTSISSILSLITTSTATEAAIQTTLTGAMSATLTATENSLTGTIYNAITATESSLTANVKPNTDLIPAIQTTITGSLSSSLTSIKAVTDLLSISGGAIVATLNGETVTLEPTISLKIAKILGLVQYNFKVYNQIYDGSSRLLTATIRIYPTAADLEANINQISEFNVTATYDTNGNCTLYKVKE